MQRSIKHSNLLPDASKLITDWFNHCREICRGKNLAYFNNPQFGTGNEQRINGQRPNILIQIDEILLKGKKSANSKPRKKNTGPMDIRIIECHKQPDGHYKFGKNRKYYCQNFRVYIARGSIIWSDMRPPYILIGQDGDGLIHESLIHSEQFVIEHGVHTQNIEREG
ncbi:hypothetical protein RF11_01556 [Thelohanellus kitauei]|uniref:ISXO2-like transposase domain-containing protein n=1 Tax=Thelohanellus kitauei TaxID=669202 RepID=A0A0C2J158_THEKT|nr:hypothetical protein RF11_01556 [Thelohanellus kitauei]